MKIIEALLTPNPFSRPEKPLGKVKGVVIHWVANPNSTAMDNRDYFNDRQFGKTDFGSAHEIIDLNGDVVIAIPKNEMAYNCGSKTYTQHCLDTLGEYPNGCTYSIECTHIDWDGKMTGATYASLVVRCVQLCKEYSLNPLTDLWLHYEVVGWKDCHRWFVNNPDEWKAFKALVNKKMKGEIIMDAIFKDWEDVAEWAQTDVALAKEKGLMVGDTEGNFKPKDFVTREQMAKIICNALRVAKVL